LKRTGSFYVGVCFAVLGLIGVLMSLTFHYWEAMSLPLCLSIIILIAAIFEIRKELRSKSGFSDIKLGVSATKDKTKTDIRSVYLLLGWILAFVAVSWVFGFLIAIPVFSFSYLKWRKRSWLVSLAFALIALTTIYLVLEVGLKSELYRGWLFNG
jgi:hypothetical protein